MIKVHIAHLNNDLHYCIMIVSRKQETEELRRQINNAGHYGQLIRYKLKKHNILMAK